MNLATTKQLDDRKPRMRRALTLLELTVTVAIISILLTVSAFAFNGVRDQSSLALARNALVTYASIARNYAMANDIETMLVVNPYDGHFEIWHLNPREDGGPWDPNSAGLAPPMTDGYAFAGVLGEGASLPLDGNGVPLVFVSPFDYQDADGSGNFYRPRGASAQDVDNLIWTALCFDENGRLVSRARRIATRTQMFLNGQNRPGPVNRVRTLERDQAPDLSLLDSGQPLVTGADSLITSTRGVIISDRKRMTGVIGENFTTVQLTQNWLDQTLQSQEYDLFTQVVIFDRQTGEPFKPGDE